MQGGSALRSRDHLLEGYSCDRRERARATIRQERDCPRPRAGAVERWRSDACPRSTRPLLVLRYKLLAKTSHELMTSRHFGDVERGMRFSVSAAMIGA